LVIIFDNLDLLQLSLDLIYLVLCFFLDVSKHGAYFLIKIFELCLFL